MTIKHRIKKSGGILEPTSFISPSSTVKTRLVDMTPQIAKDILSRNKKNRSLRPDRIDRYASDMINGNWRLNGETIIISENDNLMNGQHRLHAVVKANVVISMLLVEGVDETNFSTIDDGFTRSAADTLGDTPRANVVAAVMRLTLNYRDGGTISRARTNREIQESVERHPEIVEFISKHGSLLKLGRSVTMAALYIADQFGPEYLKSDVDNFAKGVASGENMTKYDPRFVFRNRLINFNTNKKQRPEQVVVWNFAVRSLGHFIHKKDIRILQPGHSEPTFVEIPLVPRSVVKLNW